MRIELVVDVPNIHDPAAVDAIRLGQEVVRLVRNDLHGIDVSLVHAAVGTAEALPVPLPEPEQTPDVGRRRFQRTPFGDPRD